MISRYRIKKKKKNLIQYTKLTSWDTLANIFLSTEEAEPLPRLSSLACWNQHQGFLRLVSL